MQIEEYIQTIQIHLLQTHSKLFDWFTRETTLKNYRPVDKGWTILEVLEHITLTSRYLMILVDKGADKALRNINNLYLLEVAGQFDYNLEKLNAIGIHKSFVWIRPEHMEPIGGMNELQIKCEIIEQVSRCLNHLKRLKNGEGLLYQTTMTVHDLGRLNVYEYIYFLSKHAERHVCQMEENEAEFNLA